MKHQHMRTPPVATDSAIHKSTLANLTSALALTGGALSIMLLALTAQAEVTEDCILEGTVDMRKAEQLGQTVYVRFNDARRGSDAGCSLDRRSNNSRRVKFISSPDTHDLDNATHGAKVRYRYIERDGQPGTWELINTSRDGA